MFVRIARTRAAFGHAGLETATMSDDEYMSTLDANEDDEDYRPRTSPVPTIGVSASPAKQQKKRGRRPNPNPSIRRAREAARKANHSVIEYVQRHASEPTYLLFTEGKDEKRSTKRSQSYARSCRQTIHLQLRHHRQRKTSNSKFSCGPSLISRCSQVA